MKFFRRLIFIFSAFFLSLSCEKKTTGDADSKENIEDSFKKVAEPFKTSTQATVKLFR